MNRDQGKRAAPLLTEVSIKNKSPQEPTLDKAIQSRIGDQLRAMYDELLTQPVPNRFADLIDRLDGAGAKPESESGR